MRRFWIAALLAGTVAAAGAAAYRLALGAALDRLGSAAEADLAAAVASLHGHLEPYRKLPRVLAETDTLIDALTRRSTETRHRADLLLDRLAAMTGALDIYLIEPSGLTTAASNWDAPQTFIGQNFAYRPYFTAAMQGALGRYFALGTTSLQRGFYFASPVAGPEGRAGVVVVKVAVEDIEAAWQGAPRDPAEVILAADPDGIVFLASRPELLFSSLAPIAPEALEAIRLGRQYAGAEIGPLPPVAPATRAGRAVVHLDPAAWGPRGVALTEAVRRERAADPLGLTLTLLAGTAPAHGAAREAAYLAMALTLALGLGLLLLAARRARLAERLRLEAAATARLESRVAERTRELTREVAERRAAEEALRRAQDDLVQASKLSALGQMSAGISHELNQPLAAIRSFAENARVLIERSRLPEASSNLAEIAAMTARMARIIRNLRAFARKEGEPATDVALEAVVQDALDLLARRIAEVGAEVTWHPVPAPVRGGAVRLAQVVVNLVANALDAVEGQPARRIDIALAPGPETTRLTVRDSGPGLAPGARERLFDPFFTTKSVGSGEGLGLGLSISYGIVQSFGGTIRGEDHAEGGAVFTVDLPAARRMAAE